MKTYSYWLDTLNTPPSVPPTPLPKQTTIVIIGAGITGLTTAIVTAQAGVDVTLIEKHQVKYGASTRIREELGTDYYHGGLLDPLSGELNPARYVQGLMRVALGSGVKIVEKTECMGISRQGSEFTVDTSQGQIFADW